MLRDVIWMDNRLFVAALEVVRSTFLRHFGRCQEVASSRKTTGYLCVCKLETLFDFLGHEAKEHEPTAMTSHGV